MTFWSQVWDVLASGRLVLEPLTLLALGILVFAAVQLFTAERRDAARRREAADRASGELDAALRLVQAEHYRVDALARYWDRSDLLELSTLGVLRGDELFARDDSAVLGSLARLGKESARLGGLALALRYDLARQVAIVNNSVAAFGLECASALPAARAEKIREKHHAELDPHLDRLRRGSKELSGLLWHAILQSPRGEALAGSLPDDGGDDEDDASDWERAPLRRSGLARRMRLL